MKPLVLSILLALPLLQPAVSLKGSAVAYAATIDGSYDIHVWEEGVGSRRVTTASSMERFPVWSPDRRQLLYAVERTSGFHQRAAN